MEDEEEDGLLDVVDQDDSDGSAELELLQENEESEPATPPGDITFDVNLPSAHTYLGSDLEELHGRTILDEDDHLTLPILTLPGVVLVPGQTLPLHLFQAQTIAMIKHICDKDKTFGIVTTRYLDSGPALAFVGTTAEIQSIKEELDDLSGVSTVRLKAMGRQRFEVLETRREVTGIIVAKVHILAETILPDFLEGARLHSHDRYLGSLQLNRRSPGGRGDSVRKSGTGKRFNCATWTWWPQWVYAMYDQHCLVEAVKGELRGWNLAMAVDRMPEDPILFSYWVAGNLPFDDTMKLALLQLDCAVQRLRCELGILKKCSVLCCGQCGQEVTSKHDVFTMALSGPMAAYVNPGGHVHETLTVYKAQGMSLIGRPSAEHSWFPGYSWTIANCRHCGSHKGWRFTANQKDLKPSSFWGLTRSGLQPGYEQSDGEQQWEPSL